MSDTPGQIARDARSLQQGLKELLKTRDILDKDIQVQRINLRRQYLRLLLLYPYAKDSKDAETHLWMQTSYSLISIFKQRISTLDRAIFNPPRHPPQTQSRQEQQQQNQRNFVEYRKLLQRFRQFLADEERFWGQLLLRLYRNFAIDAAEPALTALGLLPEDEPPIADGAPSRRNQFQFPPESDSVIEELLPTTTAQRESRLTTFSKALVCLGDLARYKEQYNEAGGRPRAGHEEGPPANPPTKSRGKKGPPNHIQLLPRMRNYDRAKLCYDQARLLTPHDGNPSHQLAIICSYQKEIYNSLYHYYRALCVRQPYDTAAENMGNVLHRALEQWKARGGKPKEIEIDVDGHPHQADQIQSFMERIIVLHAMWRFGGNDVDNLNQETLADFAQMLQEKVIPEEIINKAVILSQSALWKHRMIRHSSHNEKRVSRSPVVEARMATHLLGMHRAMLELSLQELNEELPKDVPKGDLAQSITAKLRRMIPALRMAGKWIRANTRYLSQARDARDPAPPEGTNASPQKSRRRTGRENQKDKNTQIVITGLRKFWDVSVRFANALNDKFPVDKLPAANQPLEEDIEMTGFLPLRKYMFGEARNKDAQGEAKAAEGEAGRQQHVMTRPDKVHPNEEQLMRISDILSDLKGIAEDEVTPIVLVEGRYVLRYPPPGQIPPPVSTDTGRATGLKGPTSDGNASHANTADEGRSEAEDDTVSRTDTDPVGDAFRQALYSEDEDEQILYPRPAPSPTPVALSSGSPTSPKTISPKSPLSPRSPPFSPRKTVEPIGSNRPAPPADPVTNGALAPIQAPSTPSVRPTTAHDLLNNVLAKRTPSGNHVPAQHARTLSNPMPPLLFGSGPNQSIWSTAVDGGLPKFPAAPVQPTPNLTDHVQRTTIHQPVHDNKPVYSTAAPTWPRSQPLSSVPQYLETSSPWAQVQDLSSMPRSNASHYRSPSETLFMTRSQPLPIGTPDRSYDHHRTASTLPIGEHANVPVGLNGLGGLNGGGLPPSVYQDTIYSASPNNAFYRQDNRDVFGNGMMPMSNDPKASRAFPAPFISTTSIWGNSG